jgi:hypothetical protein
MGSTAAAAAARESRGNPFEPRTGVRVRVRVRVWTRTGASDTGGPPCQDRI